MVIIYADDIAIAGDDNKSSAMKSSCLYSGCDHKASRREWKTDQTGYCLGGSHSPNGHPLEA